MQSRRRSEVARALMILQHALQRGSNTFCKSSERDAMLKVPSQQIKRTATQLERLAQSLKRNQNLYYNEQI